MADQAHQLTPLQVIGDQQHHRARALLEEHDLLVRADSPGGVTGPIGLAYGFTNLHGALWVRIEDESRARELIENAGLFATGDSLPIVDRSEPHCPTCGGDLDASGSADDGQCPACGLNFAWVDIELPEFDPEGVRCRECGYDLTGNTVRRCPECNSPVIPTEEQLVAQAAREFEEDAASSNVPEELHRTTLAELLTWKTIAMLSIIATVVIEGGYGLYHGGNVSLTDAVTIGIGGGMATIVALFVVRRISAHLAAGNGCDGDDPYARDAEV